MSTTSKWLSPLQRSYEDIKQTLIANLKLKVPEITDYSEGNIFIILISLFAAIAEVLHYYIDNMARETFFTTARRYSSLRKHSALVDYHVRSAIPSMVDIIISKSDNSVLEAPVDIPLGTVFTSGDGYQFISTKSVTWSAGSYGVSVPVVQKELRENIDFGTITSEDIIIQLGDLGTGYMYVEGSMNLVIGGETWELVDTFAYSDADSKVYKVELDDSNSPYVTFGNGRFGMKPATGSSITGTYYVTLGSVGNVPANNITSVPAVVSSAVSNAVATNTHASVGGTNYEDFAMLKEHVPLSIKTLGVAITEEDYRDITMLTPGVDKVYVDYICGKFIDIYITPDGGGIAPQALLDEAYQQILKRKIITTYIQVFAAGVSSIYLDIDVTGRTSFRSNDIHNQIVNALMTAYNYNTSDVGRAIRISDLYALIDNLSMVDYLKINNLFLWPYAKPQGVNTTELNFTYVNITSVTSQLTYVAVYVSASNSVEIRRDGSGQLVATVPVGTQTAINDYGNIFSITISNPNSGSYDNGATWAFDILPNNQDQLLNTYVIPVFNNSSNIVTNITETA